jgi:ABC-type transporter Mla subunit MlaD
MAEYPRLTEALTRWYQYHPNRPATSSELAAVEQRITRVLRRMGRTLSKITDLVAEVFDATNDVADKMDRQTAKIVELTAALAAAQPGSEEAAALQAQVDEAVAGFTALGSRLRDMGADPDNPVPADPTDTTPGDPVPAPEDPEFTHGPPAE